MAGITLERSAHELSLLQAEIARRQRRLAWQRDPDLWARERLGYTLWSGQRKILESVRDNRRSAAATCHEIGKSFSAAVLTGWWIDTHDAGQAFVLTSAPTAKQVRAILWKEIGRVHAGGKLMGRVNQTEWIGIGQHGNEEPIAMGNKPDEYNQSAFQGIHAPFVLVIFDEATGIPLPLWTAADSVIANDNSKFLAIGNPDDPATEFANVCKPNSGWHVMHISAFDSPNFTGEPMPKPVLDQLIGRTYVEEHRRKWAPKWFWVNENGNRCGVESGVRCVAPEGAKIEDTNPFWQSKVLGEFPERSDAGGLIPLSWIRAAQARNLDPIGPNELGQDVGGGGDSSCIAQRRGPVARIIQEDTNPDTMATCGNLLAALRDTGATNAKVDMIGIGRGVVDRAIEQKKPVYGINVGEAAVDTEAFMNLRAERWWAVRERFERGEIDIDPEDEALAGELLEIRYKRTSSGKIQIESKEEAKRRGIPSPNRADAIMLAFTPVPEPESTSLTWGR